MSGVPTSMDEVDVDELTEEIVAAIERPRRGDLDERGPDGYMQPGHLPGFGEEYDDCGDDLAHFCADCGAVIPMGRTCSRSECPRCAPMWVVDRATPNLARLQTVAKTMSARLGVPVYKHHVVMSPPDDWYLAAEDPVERTFDVVAEILEAFNAEGIVAYHGWTGQESDDRGAWKERLFNGRDWETDVRSELKPNGHFHCIIVSPFVAGGEVTKRVHERTGWIIDRIGADDDGISIESLEDAARALTYTLSHTTIRYADSDKKQNQAMYRRFGSIWHDSKVNVYDHVRRRAERAVRSVAPRTLGVSANSLRCEQPVPDGEQSDHGIDTAAAYESGSSGSTSSSGCSESCDHDHSSSSDDTVSCKGPVKPIWEADELLEDDDWIESAPYARQLKREYEEWQEMLDLDRPPPIAEVWSA